MKKKIRVLRIIGECKTGGTETIALNYYKCLKHDKIEMDFLFYGDSLPRFDNTLGENGDKVINVDKYSKNLIRSIIQIKNVVKSGNYDIVHSQLNALNMFPLLGAWLGGAKIRIAANHSTANLKYEFKKSLLKYLLKPTAGVFATHYVACSKCAGGWLFGKKNVQSGKVKIIHNAIDLEKFTFLNYTRERVRLELGWDNSFVIGHGGRFVSSKNHGLIIEIFNKVHEKLPNALLVLAGDGELMPEMQSYVTDLGLENCVQFLGVRFDMDRLMQGMDLFLFPSLYEGFGNVITEAQAVGLHVVASDVIPKEVKMTEYVEFLSLDTAINVWADTVLKYSNGYQRNDTHPKLIEEGYEIKSAAEDLLNYYFGLVNNSNQK